MALPRPAFSFENDPGQCRPDRNPATPAAPRPLYAREETAESADIVRPFREKGIIADIRYPVYFDFASPLGKN